MNAQAAVAVIGHNSVSFAEMIASEPAVIFRESEALPGLLAEIEAEIASQEVDLSSDRGRKAIASLAYGIARRKTAIDDAGKELNEAARKQINAVDEVRRKARDSLDALRDKARKPLDEWEANEEARKQRVSGTLSRLEAAAIVTASATIAEISETLDWVRAMQIDPADFDTLTERAEQSRAKAVEALTQAAENIAKAEAERAELARLRAEQERREQEAREAEQKAQAEAAERERIAAAARAAEEAAKAEAERKANEARAELERQHAAALKAEQDKAAEAERLRLEQEQRIAREKAEAEEQARLKAEEDRKRQENIEHRSTIMRAAKEALMAEAGITEEAARAVVRQIAAGAIPNVSMRF